MSIWSISNVPFEQIPNLCDAIDQPKDIEKVEADCDVCLDVTDEEMCHLLTCKHWSHESCLVEWLKRKSSCPLCRSNSNV
ncbi:zinc finger protein 364-like protein, partial [Leptotrombidium deliense]